MIKVTGPKTRIDWDSIEPEYRAGIKSVLQMAADYKERTGQSVSHQAINKHFKTLKVPRDLSAKVRARAEVLVAAALVAKTKATPIVEANIIEASAVVVANVQLSQRKDIVRHRKLAVSLLAELEEQTDNGELFAQLGDLLHAPDQKGIDKLNEIYKKVIATPGRIDSMKKLADTLKTLVGLERQAYGLSDSAEGEKPKAPEISQNESARRVAYLLLQASRNQS